MDRGAAGANADPVVILPAAGENADPVVILPAAEDKLAAKAASKAASKAAKAAVEQADTDAFNEAIADVKKMPACVSSTEKFDDTHRGKSAKESTKPPNASVPSRRVITDETMAEIANTVGIDSGLFASLSSMSGGISSVTQGLKLANVVASLPPPPISQPPVVPVQMQSEKTQTAMERLAAAKEKRAAERAAKAAAEAAAAACSPALVLLDSELYTPSQDVRNAADFLENQRAHPNQ